MISSTTINQNAAGKKVRLIFTISLNIAEEIKKIPKGYRSQLVEEAIKAKIQNYQRQQWYKKYQNKNWRIKIGNEGWGTDIPVFHVK